MRFSLRPNRGAWDLWKVLPRIRPYMRPYRKLTFTSYALTVLAAVVSLAEPWPLAIIVDNVLGERKTAGLVATVFGSDPGRYTLLMFAVLAGFIVTFLSHGIVVFNDWANAKQEQRMVLDLRSELFNHAQGLSLTFHDNRVTGRLLAQINYQAAAVGGIVVAFPPIFQALLTLIGMFTIAVLINWFVAVVSLIAVPFIWYSLGLYGTRIVPRLQRVQDLESQSLGIVHEAMSMLRVIVSFGREKYEYARFRGQGELAVDERVKLTVRETLFSLAVTSATAIGTGLVLGVGAWQVIEGKITTGELLVLISYIAAVYQPLEQISNTIGHLHQMLVSFRGSLELLDTEKEVKEAPDAIDIGRGNGGVAFEDVCFAYAGREDTLKDVSFSVEPGQRVAVVGPTGAGKTTLISLLIRFYDPRSGRVLIDGHDSRQLKLESLRNQISVVLQEPLLFSGSVADNIRYGRLEATMDEIIDAAKGANAHDFISGMPQGYDTELGERGSQLSGGERQRISVARAFIKNAPILILDEPTSSIDSRTEGVILDALEELMVGRTSFMIAHRLSTVRDADVILVMQDGRLVEQGPHEELVDLGGVYTQLYEAQNRPRVRRPHPRRAVAVGAGTGTGMQVPGAPGPPPEAVQNGGGSNGHAGDLALAELPAPPPDEPAGPVTPDEKLRQAAGAAVEDVRWRRLVSPIAALLVMAVSGLILAGVLNGDDAEQRTARPQPRAVPHVAIGDGATGVAIVDGRAYVSHAEAGLEAVDVPQFRGAAASFAVSGRSTDIAATPGSLWITGSTGSLTRVDLPDGEQTPVSLPDGSPVAVTAGASAIWVALAQEDGSSVVRLDPDDGSVQETIPIRGAIADAAADGDVLWIANSGAPTLTRVDATSGRVERLSIPAEAGSLAVGDGVLWMGRAAGARVIALDLRTARETGRTVRVGATPTALAVTGPFLYSVAAGAGRLERVRVGS